MENSEGEKLVIHSFRAFTHPRPTPGAQPLTAIQIIQFLGASIAIHHTHLKLKRATTNISNQTAGSTFHLRLWLYVACTESKSHIVERSFGELNGEAL
jgi:hypothetical protein